MKRLAEIRERAEKAAIGPWRHLYKSERPLCMVIRTSEGTGDRLVACAYTVQTTDFIANARIDIPWLVHEVERLTALVEEAEWCDRDPLGRSTCPWCEGLMPGVQSKLKADHFGHWDYCPAYGKKETLLLLR